MVFVVFGRLVLGRNLDLFAYLYLSLLVGEYLDHGLIYVLCHGRGRRRGHGHLDDPYPSYLHLWVFPFDRPYLYLFWVKVIAVEVLLVVILIQALLL